VAAIRPAAQWLSDCVSRMTAFRQHAVFDLAAKCAMLCVTFIPACHCPRRRFMRRITWFPIVLFVVLGLSLSEFPSRLQAQPPTLSPAPRSNEDDIELLTNGGFETGDTGGWHINGTPPNAFIVTPTATRSGSYGARLAVGPHGSCVAETDHYLVRVGGTYSAQVYFYLVSLSGTPWLTTQVNYYDASHSFLTSSGIGNTYWESLLGGWTLAHSNVAVPPEARYASLLVNLQESIGEGSAEAYFDDASLFGPPPFVSLFVPLLVRP
jgi:hypothetical protein